MAFSKLLSPHHPLLFLCIYVSFLAAPLIIGPRYISSDASKLKFCHDCRFLPVLASGIGNHSIGERTRNFDWKCTENICVIRVCAHTLHVSRNEECLWCVSPILRYVYLMQYSLLSILHSTVFSIKV